MEHPPTKQRPGPRAFPQAQRTLTAREGSILSIIYVTVSGIVAITTHLYSVTKKRSEVGLGNQELGTNLHELSSPVANEMTSHEEIRPL